MQATWKPLLAEAIGTFALIFIGAGAIITDAVTKGHVGVLGIALAHGLAIAVMVSALGAISGGHFNPAVTCGFLEAIGTFFLVVVVFGTAVSPQAPRIGGLAIGLTIAMDVLAFGPLTGAAVNPARAFGPALVAGWWKAHLVYWIGPIIGGVVAGWVYANAYLSEVK